MLQSLAIRGFKGYGETGSIPLHGLTVLIGRNGTGKTTILQALDMLGSLVRGTLPEYLQAQGWSYSDLPHLLSAKQRFGVTANFPNKLSWEIELSTKRHPGIAQESVKLGKTFLLRRDGRMMRRVDARGTEETIKQTLTSSWLATLDPDADHERFPQLSELADWASRIRGYLFLDPLALRKSARVGEDIGRTGEHLAGFLGRLKRRDSTALQRIQDRVQRHYPRLRKIDVRPGSYGWTNLHVTERWGRAEATFNARQVSDGLLRLIAIASLYELEVRPSFLLLDEVENGLHSSILAGFLEMLQQLVEDSQGQTQVLVTTHSVVALNFVRDPKQVILVHRDKGGSSRVTPVTSLRDFNELRQHFDLGEMIYNVGEDRLLGVPS
jgi:predicted ATPase